MVARSRGEGRRRHGGCISKVISVNTGATPNRTHWQYEKTVMGNGGKLIKSTAELKTAGTYRKDRHANRVEQVAENLKSIPKPPSDFDKRHTEKWNEVCKRLKSLGVLTEQDLDIVENYVQSWIISKDAYKNIVKNGLVIWITIKTGEGRGAKETTKPIQNPAFRMHQDAAKMVKVYAEQIGYTPRARMGIKINSNKKEKQASILDFIKGGSIKKAV